MAVAFTDAEKTFVSEASVYRILQAEGLVTSPAFIAMKDGRSLRQPDDGDQPALANRLHLPQGHRLGMVLSLDGARRLLALHRRWKLCTTMSAADVTATLELALQASGLEHTNPDRQPRLLSDNGPSYVANDQSPPLSREPGQSHPR